MDEQLKQHCELLRAYCEGVIQPSCRSFLNCLSDGSPAKHLVVSQTILLHSAIDYLLPVWRAHAALPHGKDHWYAKLVASCLDQALGVCGSTFLDNKYLLVFGMSNAIKHVELDAKRHPEINDEYGNIGFDSLVDHEGGVFFKPGKDYLFDFSRVIVRPVSEAWLAIDFEDVELEEIPDMIARPDIPHDFGGLVGSEDLIDAMIEYCNPICGSCDLDNESCKCSNFVFNGVSGEFEPIQDPSFDFDTVMSQISGAYKA